MPASGLDRVISRVFIEKEGEQSQPFHRFQASRQLAPFVEALQPRVLRDELPTLVPEVMQALADHFTRAGRPEQVEKCVLRMDVLSLDLNQVTKALRTSHLSCGNIATFALNTGLIYATASHLMHTLTNREY